MRGVGAHPGDSNPAQPLHERLQGEVPELSIVLPAYDEAERMRPRLPTVLEFLAASPWSWELILLRRISVGGSLEEDPT